MTQLTSPPGVRVMVRRFRPDDGAGLHGYLADPEVVRFEPYEPLSREECDRLADERAVDDRFWAVCLRDSGALIGNLWFAPVDPVQWRTWELGFVFRRDQWGCGYASQASRMVLAHAFTELGAHRVTASCDVRNDRSWRVMERLGMRREGHQLANASFRQRADGSPIWVDSYQYALLASEWPARR